MRASTVVFLAVGLMWLIILYSRHDDSDPPGGHSNLQVYTDARTGCQYLGHGFGGLIQRFDESGKQICERKNDGNQR